MNPLGSMFPRRSLDEVIVHAPIRVFWHGWESDLRSLRQGGWEVFGHEEQKRMSLEHALRVAVKSPDNRLVISGVLQLPYELMRFGDESRLYDVIAARGIEMKMYQASDMIHSYEMPLGDLASWRNLEPIDVFAPMDFSRVTMRDLKLFKYEHCAPKEIFVPAESVDDCLNRILQLQYPDMKKFREDKVIPVVQARVLTLAA